MPKRKKKGRDEPTIEYETEIVPIDQLSPHPRNYRDHPDDQIKHLIESIMQHGFYRNVVVARDGTILAGHGVVEAARAMELEAVPVVRLDIEPDDVRAMKVLTGDNEIGHLSHRDDRLLTEILREVRDNDDSGLLGTGLDDMMLANLVFVTRPKSEIESINEAAEWVGMPEYDDEGEKRFDLVLRCYTEEDRDEFIREHELGTPFRKEKKAWLFFWPRQEKNDWRSFTFEPENDGVDDAR
jgi:hypothetical protein